MVLEGLSDAMASFTIRRRGSLATRLQANEISPYSRRPRIYLAGPTVFMPDKVARGVTLKALCETVGCEGLYPLLGRYAADDDDA